jgi:hypothetical protein
MAPRPGAKGPGWTPDFRAIDPARADSYVGRPRFFVFINCEEIAIMAHRIRRAWSFALAIVPISAIVLVEAAMRRW